MINGSVLMGANASRTAFGKHSFHETEFFLPHTAQGQHSVHASIFYRQDGLQSESLRSSQDWEQVEQVRPHAM